MPKSNTAGKQLILRNWLVNGQWFNWYPIKEHDYIGVLRSYIIRIKQDMDSFDIHFRYHTFQNEDKKKVNHTKAIQEMLNDYFQLDDVDLVELYKEWSADKYFASIGPYLPGLRILQQDPWEWTISFLVSQNNNITRITNCLRKIRTNYGEKIGTISDVADKDEEFSDFAINEFYTFPTWDKLSSITESDLKNLGLGYRANYIATSVKLIKDNGGEDWIRGLRIQNNSEVKRSKEEEKIELSSSKNKLQDLSTVYNSSLNSASKTTEWNDSKMKSNCTDSNNNNNLLAVREKLLTLKGVGKKVADWIALFSMNCHNSIPVDTHVHQIANRVYGKGTKEKVTMNDKIYNSVVLTFNKIFGSYWGWAHSVLFAAELPKYKEIIANQKAKTKVSGKRKRTKDVLSEDIQEVNVASKKQKTI